MNSGAEIHHPRHSWRSFIYPLKQRSSAHLIDDDGDSLATRQRIPARRDGRRDGPSDYQRRDLGRLDQGGSPSGRRHRWKLQNGFALARLVAHCDGHPAPPRGVGRPHRLALNPPNVGLTIDLDVDLRLSRPLHHARGLNAPADREPCFWRSRLATSWQSSPGGRRRRSLGCSKLTLAGQPQSPPPPFRRARRPRRGSVGSRVLGDRMSLYFERTRKKRPR